MPNDNAIKFGILKTRDLVELYYGARMVTSIAETTIAIQATSTILLGADPRRIRYEVWFQQLNTPVFRVGSPAVIDAGNGISLLENGNQAFQAPVIIRDWLTDGEAVCLPLSAIDPVAGTLAYVRETFLTPIPVDEMP